MEKFLDRHGAELSNSQLSHHPPDCRTAMAQQPMPMPMPPPRLFPPQPTH